jgi:Plasmid pRiA4b ORF-3-like protein
MKPYQPHPDIYQLRIVLRGISPLIWRRLLVRSDTTLAQLHLVLQILFDWSNEHLHHFRIFHIPTDLVVAQEASAVESSSRLDFLVLHNLGTSSVAP